MNGAHTRQVLYKYWLSDHGLVIVLLQWLLLVTTRMLMELIRLNTSLELF